MMTTKSYVVEISDEYVVSAINTNEDYVNFVMNKAAESYQNQYGTSTVEEGITAAREAYIASSVV